MGEKDKSKSLPSRVDNWARNCLCLLFFWPKFWKKSVIVEKIHQSKWMYTYGDSF